MAIRAWLFAVAALPVPSATEDEQKLLALRYNFHEEVATGGPQATATLLQELAHAAVTNGLTIDDFTKEALSSIKGMLESTQGSLVESHHEDQKLLNDHADQVHGCRAEEKVEEKEDNDTSTCLYDSQQAHADCRAQLPDLQRVQNETCHKLTEHMDEQRENPPVCEKPTEKEDVEKYYLDLQKFVQERIPVWRRLEHDCKAAHRDFAAKDHECDRLQVKFERNYCEWRFQTIATCSMYFACMSRAQELYDQTKEAVLDSAENRKLDFKAIENIDCNIDVLLMPATDTGAREGAYNACQTAEHDVSQFDIEAPDLSHLKPCDISSVREYPCTENFIQHNHYHEMIGIRECHLCNELPPRLHAAIASLEE